MKKALLLVNLGSPDSTKTKDVRRYLREFLMDPLVIDIPFLARFALVQGIIAPFRAPKSAEAYKKIWWSEGSPLKVITESLFSKVSRRLPHVRVAWAMRYGKPSIESRLLELVEEGVEEVFVLPLYPQYAESTTRSTIEEVQRLIARYQMPFKKLHWVREFYAEPDFVAALRETFSQVKLEEWDHVLFSFHGIPERHIRKVEKGCEDCLKRPCQPEDVKARPLCYRSQCYETARLTAKSLGLAPDKYSVSFQSRLGRDPWIKPYTDHVIESMPEKGIKRLLVSTPAFTADCLETLEEIAMEAKDEFLEAGGEKFEKLACVNDSSVFVDFIVRLFESFEAGKVAKTGAIQTVEIARPRPYQANHEINPG